MDLFCNDKYWTKMEDKGLPKFMKPELQRRKFEQLEQEEKPELLNVWGDYDYKFKLKA